MKSLSLVASYRSGAATRNQTQVSQATSGYSANAPTATSTG